MGYLIILSDIVSLRFFQHLSKFRFFFFRLSLPNRLSYLVGQYSIFPRAFPPPLLPFLDPLSILLYYTDLTFVFFNLSFPIILIYISTINAVLFGFFRYVMIFY